MLDAKTRAPETRVLEKGAQKTRAPVVTVLEYGHTCLRLHSAARESIAIGLNILHSNHSPPSTTSVCLPCFTTRRTHQNPVNWPASSSPKAGDSNKMAGLPGHSSSMEARIQARLQAPWATTLPRHLVGDPLGFPHLAPTAQ